MDLSRTVRRLLLAGAVVTGALLTGCSKGRLPKPAVAPGDAARTDETALVATHPPPAALPEIISERPSQRAQWLAGSWVWQGNSWVWQRGGWIENPERLRLVDSQVRYTTDGTLEFYPRRWVSADGEAAQAPSIVRPAGTPPTPQLREEHTIP